MSRLWATPPLSGATPARESGAGATPRPRRGAGGFTLLEVMIAMAILAISLVTVYQSQSQSISMATDARFLTSAALLAQARMAQIAAAPPGENVAGSGDFGEAFPDYTWQVDVAAVEENALIRKVTVAVVNRRMTQRNTFRLTLYRVATP